MNPEEQEEYVSLTDFSQQNKLKRKLCCENTVSRTDLYIFFAGIALGAAAVLAGLALMSATSSFPPTPGNDTNTSQFGCSLQKDVQILLTMGSDFLDEQSKCGRANLGVASTTAICLEKATHVSAQCGTVYGQLTECGKHNCMFPCFNGASEKCTACICKHCRAAFVTRIKIPCTLIPTSTYTCHDCPGHLASSSRWTLLVHYCILIKYTRTYR